MAKLGLFVMLRAQHSILSNIACAMSVSAPLTDIWGVTKSRTLQGNSVCRRNRHGRAVVPNVMASRTAVLSTEMKSAVGMIKRFFVVKLRATRSPHSRVGKWRDFVTLEQRAKTPACNRGRRPPARRVPDPQCSSTPNCRC